MPFEDSVQSLKYIQRFMLMLRWLKSCCFRAIAT